MFFLGTKKRNKFSIDEKEKIVLTILKGKTSYRSTALKYQTSHRLISLWVDCYKMHGKSGLSFINGRVYTGEFKLGLLKEMETRGLSLQQMSAKHLITPSTLSIWRRQYEQFGASALFTENPRGRPPKMKQKSENKPIDSISEYDKLLKENQRLRAENDYLKKLRALIQKKETQKKD